jgi:hypothetical protein
MRNQDISFDTQQTCTHNPGGRVWLMRALWLLLAAGGAGCGAAEPLTEAGLGRQAQEQIMGNGMSLNGLTVNGLTVNGLTVNGLGLEGLASAEFRDWFAQDPAQHAVVMEYVVLCAAPSGVTLTYTPPDGTQSYTWGGRLGLAPDWAGGNPANLAEQQVVSACLLAHVNKYGVHVFLSLLGRTSTGGLIPYTNSELETYNQPESCFFGNLFNTEGGYVGSNATLASQESSVRACGLWREGSSGPIHQECPPLVHVGGCAERCTLDSSGDFYSHCTYGGRSYPALTTRIRRADVYQCGDGACQVSEACGTSDSPDSCRDCGPCR